MRRTLSLYAVVAATVLLLLVLAFTAGPALAEDDADSEVITACVLGQTVQITYGELSELHADEAVGAYYGPCTGVLLPDTALLP